MEPATLWFERRVRRVKRATSGKLLVPWPGIKGRRLSIVSVVRPIEIAHLRSPGKVSRRALSSSLPMCWLQRTNRKGFVCYPATPESDTGGVWGFVVTTVSML